MCSTNADKQSPARHNKLINSYAKSTAARSLRTSGTAASDNLLSSSACFSVQIIPYDCCGSNSATTTTTTIAASSQPNVSPYQWKPFDGYRRYRRSSQQPQQQQHHEEYHKQLSVIASAIAGLSRFLVWLCAGAGQNHHHHHHSSTNFFMRSVLLLLLFDCCVWRMTVVMAAPQSCILCNKNDLSAADLSRNRNYEEFVFEHQVTRNEAIESLQTLNDSFYGGPPDDSYCKSITCTNKIMKYCVGQQFINDHCLCEFGHTVEGLPFVPHICYVGEKLLKPSSGSCYVYVELKECCCGPVLALQWRHISGSASSHVNNMALTYMLILFGGGILTFDAFRRCVFG